MPLRATIPVSMMLCLSLFACPGDDGTTAGGTGTGTTADTTDASPTTEGTPPATTTSEGTTATTEVGDTTSTDATTGMPGTDGSTTSGSGSEGSTGQGVDMDGDGVPTPADCNDDDPLVYPGAPERCNGEDDDCDRTTSEQGVVSVDGEGSYSTIGDAIAASSPGSEVLVCPGTYIETVAIGHDLHLVSLQGWPDTIIDANNAGPTVSVSAGVVTLTGLTLTGGSSMGLGGGLSVTGTDLVTVDDCMIIDNQSTDGAGIYTYANAQLVVTQSTIANNLGGIGGGIMMQGQSLTITDSTIVDNLSDETGGGLVAFGPAVVTITGSSITDNTSLDGGGVSVIDAMVTLDTSTIERNVATGNGGGMWVAGGSGVSINSDWGTGADENLPQDVRAGGIDYGYGVGASFSCSPAGCL